MKLDFFTLYIVIILLPLTLTSVWAAVVFSYRNFLPARYWLCGCLGASIGGFALTFQDAYGLAPAVFGNSIIVFSWWLFWLGARRLHGTPGGMRYAVIATALFATVTISLFPIKVAIAYVYAIGQSVPMALIMVFLLSPRRRSAGGYVASAGAALGILAHAVMGVTNLVYLCDGLSQETAIQVASFTMLPVVFSGIVLNFGFAVMTVDGLRAEITELAHIDPLTGVWNRRKFDETLAAEWAHSLSSSRPLALMLIDLDSFKDINDAHGHAAGDKALIHFAGVVGDALRPGDFLARLGGDEFCVLLRETALAQTETLAERVAQRVRDERFVFGPHTVMLLCSIGIALSLGSDDDVDAVLARADHALYAVKGNARGGVGPASKEPTR